MSDSIPIHQMEYGKQYEVVRKDDPNTLRVEVVDRVRREIGVPARVLEEVVFLGRRYKKGERVRLDDDDVFLRAKFLRSGKPIAKYSTQELMAKPTNLWRATLGEEYAFHLPRSAGKEGVFDPTKIFFATLLDREEKDTLFSEGRVRLKVKVEPEFAKAWGLDDPVLEWKSIPPPRMWKVPEKHAFARNLVFLNESMEPEFKLPLEMLGEIQKFQSPNRTPRPYPESYKTGRTQGASNAAAKGGRRKKTRRRN